jgi:hypothetical protein
MSDDGKMDKGMVGALLGGNISEYERRYIEVNGLAVDIDKYAKYSSWTVMEAVCIFHGLDPIRAMSAEYLKPYQIYKDVLNMYDISQRAAADGLIPSRGDPILFFHWAEMMELPIPEGIKAAALLHTLKRDAFEDEQQSRMETAAAKIEIDRREHEAKENPSAPDPTAEPLFEVNKELDVREEFHEQIKTILIKMSKAGSRRPTGAEMRDYLKANPESTALFVGITKHNEIEYAIEGNETKVLSRQALHKLILRLVIHPNLSHEHP